MRGIAYTYHKKTSFQVVGGTISQEIPHDQNGHDQEHHHEYFKVEIHGFPQTPSYNDDKRRVEKGGLYRGSQAMVEGKVL